MELTPQERADKIHAAAVKLDTDKSLNVEFRRALSELMHVESARYENSLCSDEFHHYNYRYALAVADAYIGRA